MCRTTTYPQPTCNAASNATAVELTVAFQGTIEYLFDNINQEVEGLNSYFNSIQEFYDFLTLNGINIIDCNSSIISSLKAKSKLKNYPIEEVLFRKPTTLTNNELAIIEMKKVNNTYNQVLGKSGESIETYISNVTTVNSGNSTYCDVEISVKSNTNNIFLDAMVFKLKYNKNSFGNNVSSATSFTQNSLFPSNVYNLVSISDQNDSTLKVYFFTTFTTPPRTQITTTGKIIGTFRIPYTNCKLLANLKIDTNSNFALYSYFTNSSTSSTVTQFSSFIAGSFNAGSVCPPVINNISNNLRAGTGDILTIDGNNFGNIKGNISMKNADGLPDYIALDKYDITQWTNSQIKIKVPSIVDSADFNGTVYNKHPVGSGPLKVTDAYGTTSTSPFVYINYAVANGSKLYNGVNAKTNVLLYSDNNDGIYHYKLNANITNPLMIDCIKAAIRRWRCTTGMPIVLDNGTVTNNINNNDGINVILLNNISNLDIHATTWNHTISACSNDSTIPIPLFGNDIEINQNQTRFIYDTTGSKNIPVDSIDFFATIMHELGHAIGLKHVLNLDMIMIYGADNSIITPVNKRNLFIKNNDLASGNYMVNNSLVTPNGLNCAYNYALNIQPTNCTWNNSLSNINSDLLEFKAFPNPFNTTINLEFNANQKTIATLVIYDVMGNKVYDNKEINVKSGSNNFTVSNLNLSNGLYFINLFIDGENITCKIICTK